MVGPTATTTTATFETQNWSSQQQMLGPPQQMMQQHLPPPPPTPIPTNLTQQLQAGIPSLQHQQLTNRLQPPPQHQNAHLL